MSHWRFLLSRAVAYRRQLGLIAAVNVLGSLSLLSVPWLAGELLGDVVDAGTGAPSAVPVALLLVAALVATTALTIATTVLSQRNAMRILADLRLETYDHVMGLPLGFHDRSRQGDILALMTYEVSALSQFLTSTLATAPAMLLTASGAIVLLFLIDPVLALLLPVAMPAFYIVLRLAGRRLRAMASHARKAHAMVFAEAESQLEMLPAIRAFAAEPVQRRAYAERVEESRRLVTRQTILNGLIAPIVALVAALAAIAILLLAGDRIGTGQTSVAELFRFLLYAALLTRPLGALAGVYGSYQVAAGTLSRLRAVLREKREQGHQGGEVIGRAQGDLELDRVDFSYSRRGPVLRAASVQIRAGERIALTGENGAGKSTLVHLLLRFYEPDAGTIRLDGRDIATLDVRSLRRQFGLVPQRDLLFNGTIRDNIVFGLPEASEERIAVAIRLAQAESFIAALPQGLDTQIGDRGVRLSGGQRQRIALARALVPDPPILVFDEATAMFDLEGEAAFIASCAEALEGRTVIIITHRPASLALAQRVFVISDGELREV